MPPQALATVAVLLGFAPHGNRIELKLDHGSAELVWIAPSTFRFRRAPDGPLPAVKWEDKDAVKLEIDDTPGALRLRSRFLEVSIQKHGLLVGVRRRDGEALMTDLSEPRAEAGGVTWDRRMPAGAGFYGLGPRGDPVLNLRGKAVRAEIPFLVCTRGYGEYHAGAGSYQFDFTPENRYHIQAPGIDYFFYYGPTPKEIFEEHHSVRALADPWPASSERPGSWATLRAALLRLTHGAMSAALAPEFDLAPYADAPPELLRRARQLGSLVPKVMPGAAGLSGFHKQLESFFAIYALEVRDRGFPTWHPLPFQFPDDPEGARHADEFMLGDEMLIAPVCDPGGRRTVYLPRGIWTNLETNGVVQGKSTITVETQSLPVFARNGTIVPLDSAAGIALHYFPMLAAEFFLLESDLAEYSQVHAAPAADILRLEIESKKDRDYQWVVHHVERPAAVGFEDQQYRQASALNAMADGTWFYDAALKNLHVRVRAKAGEDCIINLTF